MSDQLRAAIDDLADRTAPAEPPMPDPAALWSRGRRSRRRRVAASVLAAVAVLATAGVVLPGVTERVRTTPAPASYDEAELRVPDHVWTPSSWAPAAGPAAPPGPLALVARAPRLGPWILPQTEQWFGVSAVDQTQRWLELPGLADGDVESNVALSPDGTRLAYFLAGEPSADRPQSDMVGFAVLDLVTGEVAERTYPTRFGLHSALLEWSADSRWLVVGPAQYSAQRGGSRLAEVEAWHPASGSVQPIERVDEWEAMAAAPGGTATWRGGRLVRLDTATGTLVGHRVDWWWQDDSQAGEPVHNLEASRVAWVDGQRRGRGELRGTWPAVYTAAVAPTGAPGRPERLSVTGQPTAVLGWLTPTTVVVETSVRLDEDDIEPVRRILAVDVESGETQPVIDRPDSWEAMPDLQLAGSLLARPLAEGRRPPLHLPWGPTSVGALLGLAAAVGLVRRTRRRRVEQALDSGDPA